ncbi:hypothetical protein KAX06_09145, partial [candidate division WOR-3 bacterium]|nr:hypothetical protein [candidate division WOR-3 bacterium]
MRRAKRARCVLGLLFIVGILFVCLSQAGNAANAILDKIEIEVTSQHQIPVGTAVVGDVVKILAVLRPKVDGTAVEEELAVRFFFENRSTRETGLIGQASIPGLRGVKGEFRKAAVEWDPANMEPGYYNILAVGEFETSVSEDETTLKVLQEGKYFQFILNSRGVPVADKQGNVVMSQYLMGDEVARMPSGDFSKLSYRLSREKRFYIVNLGTENIASGDTFNLKCEYKTEHKDTFEELVEGCTVLGLAPGSIGPGEKGQLRLFLQFPFDFEGVRVGEPKKIQLRIQATDQKDVTSPTSPPVYLPSTDESLTVYSWVDLWTFPEPAGASSGNTGTDVTLSPVVVPTWTTYREGKDLVTNGELVVFHVETTQTEPKSLLYSHAIAVNKVINYYIKKQYSRWTDEEGEVVAWKPPDPAAEILAFTAVKDPQGVILLYIATHDGWVYGLRDNAAKNPLVPDNFETIWSQPDQIPIPSEDAEDFILHQPDVVTDADGNPVFVVFSTDVGLFAFDAYSGDLRWKITDSDKIPVTQPPIHFTDDDIWFASEERVYHFADPGVGGIPRPQEAERAAVTAPIALQTYTDTETDVAVLAEEGTLIVKDPYLL